MSALKAIEDKPLLGIAMMLLAFFLFSFIDTSAKWLALAGLPVLQLVFMRYLGHLILSAVIVGRDGWQDLFPEKLGLVVLRAALLLGATILNFIALRYLPLTLTSTILFSAPIMLCALSRPLLGEHVGVWRWCAIVVGFVGIIVAIRPFEANFHWAVFLSLTSALCFVFYTILTRKLAGIVSVDIMQFYGGAVGTVVMLPFAFFVWQPPGDWWQWTVLIALGFFGWFGHQVMTNAHRFATATTLTPFSYVFILYLTVWSYFVFDQLPDFWTIVGGSIIIMAGLFIWMRQRKLIQSAIVPN